MILKGKGGIQYNLEVTPFAQGGEGQIFNISGHPDKVAKVYCLAKRTDLCEEKLTLMCNNPPDESVLIRIAWPVDILYESGTFVGYVMPKFTNLIDIEAIFSLDIIEQSVSWPSCISIAKNLCAVIDELHRLGYVLGDFNPRNIKWDYNGYAVLLAADSYHITAEDKVFRCETGIPEYIPVELQEKMKQGFINAELPTYTVCSDRFALAVLLFQILVSGAHPFQDRNNKIAENIAEGYCPYLQNPIGYDAAVSGLGMGVFTKEIAKLFRLAFVEGHNDPSARPSAHMWYDALKKMRMGLVRCIDFDSHYYCRHLRDCPWCYASFNLHNDVIEKNDKANIDDLNSW